MHTDILVRPATSHDAAQLARFGAQTFLETFGHLYPDDDKATFLADRFSLDRTRADIEQPGRYLQLAMRGDTLVGFLDCGTLGLPVHEPEDGAVELYRLYLDTSCHGTGLANTLMDMALAWAKAQSAPAVYLGVFVDNQRAQAFYRKYGFAIVGAYHFKVGNTLDDERIMRLGLAEG